MTVIIPHNEKTPLMPGAYAPGMRGVSLYARKLPFHLLDLLLLRLLHGVPALLGHLVVDLVLHAQALAQGATEQASAIQELSATIQDIAVNARQNAKRSEERDRLKHGIN